MAYITQSDLTASYITVRDLAQLVVDDAQVADETTPDEALAALAEAGPQAVLADAIARAEDDVNEALSARYAVPVAADGDGAYPDQLRSLVMRRVKLLLLERRGLMETNEYKSLAQTWENEADAIREGRRRVYGLTQTKGLAVVTGSVNPLTSKPYTTNGAGDPDVANDGKTDPLANY